MKRVIVDYKKLTDEILNLLVQKFPDGYDREDIIRFQNAQNELVEAVEVRTEDTIYLVKVSKALATSIENFEEDDEDSEPVEPDFDDEEFDDDNDY
jgi:hypothetical protein